jgi:hypothetical protein
VSLRDKERRPRSKCGRSCACRTRCNLVFEVSSNDRMPQLGRAHETTNPVQSACYIARTKTTKLALWTVSSSTMYLSQSSCTSPVAQERVPITRNPCLSQFAAASWNGRTWSVHSSWCSNPDRGRNHVRCPLIGRCSNLCNKSQQCSHPS